jgi:CRISPR-associated endonuclease/helicase Cas3
MYYAHSCNDRKEMQGLQEHLVAVAEGAAGFAAQFGGSELAHWAGLWHDIGKFHPDFQAYLLDPGSAARGPDHKAAGALAAQRAHLDALAFLIQGHHGGLTSVQQLKQWIREKTQTGAPEVAIEIARLELPGIEPGMPLTLPSGHDSPLALDVFLRMLFSALVDADFLDTERHFNLARAELRESSPDLQPLFERLTASQAAITGKLGDPVNQARNVVYEACIKAATQSPGFFRLTVPTGGGKTRSSLAFGLSHAIAHGLQRVITAIPYTSIIEQTADVYRHILGREAVLEHHSAVAGSDDPEAPSLEEMRRRLAAENWDAPVVVTTTVQLFESLFARETSRCRKLHNIAGSVVILDEVQTLPVRLLDPILDMLRHLVARYQVSVLLCTATQPALDDSPYLKGLPEVREIAPEPGKLFASLQRVTYEFDGVRKGITMRWDEVAAEMRNAQQALAVVNTKKDALALLNAIGDEEALHLSTLMCGAHRRDTLAEIRIRLAEGRPCRLVSTQVVEAGVDLDFPLVLRALGPLDRIVQAAGRCNREGRLAPHEARVVVFVPEEAAHLPPGEYESATRTTQMLLRVPGFDFHDPGQYRSYFERLYGAIDLDAREIQPCRARLDFEATSERFRLIEEDTVPLAVRYYGRDGGNRTVDELLARAASHPAAITRSLIRQLQPYLVSMRRKEALRSPLVREIQPGLYEWTGVYHTVCGVSSREVDPATLVI